MPGKRNTFPYVEAIFGLLLLSYVTVRAAVVPITIDEAQTCIVYSRMPVWDIISYTDPIPNNHILNTLLIKFFSFVFGMKDFTVRLPNVLGFVVFYASVVLIMLRLFRDSLPLRLSGLVLLTCNPFFMDFFSLARGYALSCAFIALAVWLSIEFLSTRNRKYLFGATTAAAIAVYANFTALNFYAALSGSLFMIIWLRRPLNTREAFNDSLVIAAISGALAAICFMPVKRMVETKQFVFWGSEGFYHNTVASLVKASLRYGKWYKDEYTGFLAIAFIVIVLVTAAIVFIKWQREPGRFGIPAFLYLLLSGTIVVNVLQFHLIRTPYLDERTALSFFILTGFALAAFGTVVHQNKKQTSVWATVVVLSGVLHFLSAANFRYCYQWWFNQNDKQVLAYLEEQHNNTQQKITLDCNWLFHPSLNFYYQTESLDWLGLQPFHSDVRPLSPAGFYYAEGNDKAALDSVYVVVTDFGGGRFLMKRR